MLNLNDVTNSNYVDYEHIVKEINEAKKLYKSNTWPIIDVTRKSVEETAANVIKLYQQFKLEA
jgi:hypothetical protein